MNKRSKIEQLKNIIVDRIAPLINNDYIYLDLPFYQNIGDTLIWEGTESFLSILPHKCLYKASKDTFEFQPLSVATVIILQGGGNFSDIWYEHQAFRCKIIEQYPNNPIIVLPQTVYYESKEFLERDAACFRKHKNITICARDARSFALLKSAGFSDKLLLVPDMAFCVSTGALKKYMINKDGQSHLVLVQTRRDKELKEKLVLERPQDFLQLDWPVYESVDDKIIQDFWMLKGQPITVINAYAHDILKPHLIKIGVEYTSAYKYAVSTRLHGAILRILLGLDVCICDNSYGKNLAFYTTWLKGTKGVSFYNGHNISLKKLMFKRFLSWIK